METMSDKYYYCLTHRIVESEDGCKAADRMGPYDSAVEASHALTIAAERTKAWDDDPDWNDTEPDSDAAPEQPTE